LSRIPLARFHYNHTNLNHIEGTCKADLQSF